MPVAAFAVSELLKENQLCVCLGAGRGRGNLPPPPSTQIPVKESHTLLQSMLNSIDFYKKSLLHSFVL